MSAPRQTGAAGRPTLSLSLALNHAISGYSVFGFHILNILIHTASALLVLSILRRTLRSHVFGGRFDAHGDRLALVIALAWAVHPLHTMCVTYIVQRAESMMGLCYLATMYCVMRHHDAPNRRWWGVASVVFCLTGMGAKEVMATAPLVILVYDAIFLSNSFRESLRRRKWVYGGLAACWIPLGLMVAAAPRSESAGLSLASISAWEYLRTQPQVILHYIRLVVYPYPLVLDYEWPVAKQWCEIAGPGAVILVLLAATSIGVYRRRPWAMLGVWFFGVLAVSSSVVPIVIVASEHRMYLPSVTVIAILVLGGDAILSNVRSIPGYTKRVIVGAAILSLCGVTIARNRDYYSAIALWKDVISKRPANPRGHCNLGAALEADNDLAGALRHIEHAVALNPRYGDARYNLGSVLGKLGRVDEAMVQLEECLRLRPNEERAHYNLGYAYQLKGRYREAIGHYRAALEIRPSYVMARSGLGVALAFSGVPTDAIAELRTALASEPNHVATLNTLAWLLATCPRPTLRNGPDAVKLAERANQLTGGTSSGALDTLAAAYAEAGRYVEAAQTGEKALTIAESEKQGALAEAIRARVALYRQSKPFRDSTVDGQ
ncbi:MAG: tetratricopeptide repeat protein [Planctomycetes bacterium]|nr:tetratricopeptide repeat protein [Planctomycetota bacterium]